MPRKIYIALALIACCFIINFRNIDAFYIALFLLIFVGFYFRVSAARYLALFFANYAVLLVLIFVAAFGKEFKVDVGGYNPNPIFSLSAFIIALILFIYSISGKEVEAYFSRKLFSEKWLSYINIHVVILYFAVGLASITYYQLIEKGHEIKSSYKNP